MVCLGGFFQKVVIKINASIAKCKALFLYSISNHAYIFPLTSYIFLNMIDSVQGTNVVTVKDDFSF